ncbi:glyoxalase [Aureococcus anophagefferens]|nr:glyoxalase [Aureococcus anophagefferens]
MPAKKVLLVSTSASSMGGNPTGLWLAELAEPYYILKEAGLEVTLASSSMADDFDCLYLAGGHGCCVDFVGEPGAELKACVEKMYAAGKVVAADCHGPMGLIEPTKPDGTPLVAGLEVCAFTNTEEAQAGATDWVKANSVFMEDEFKAKGGAFKEADPWTSNVCVAGNLMTAQNPQSATACAQAVVAAMNF